MSANTRRPWLLVTLVALLVGACSSGTSPLPTIGPTSPPIGSAGSSVGAAASSPSATPKPATATVTLALDWTPNTNHTGFYVAQQSGWYADQAIDLQLIPYASANPETLVGAGQADCGISTEEGATFAIAAGEKALASHAGGPWIAWAGELDDAMWRIREILAEGSAEELRARCEALRRILAAVDGGVVPAAPDEPEHAFPQPARGSRSGS